MDGLRARALLGCGNREQRNHVASLSPLLARLSLRSVHNEVHTCVIQLSQKGAHVQEARLVLRRLMPEGLKIRRDARGKVQVRYGLQFLELPGW